MTAAWMAYAAVVVCLVAGATVAMSSLRERQGAGSRWVWLSGLLFASILVLSAPFRVAPVSRPMVELPVTVDSVRTAPVHVATWTDRVRTVPAMLSTWVTVQLSGVARWPGAVQGALAALWLVSSVGVAAVFGLVVIGMHRRRGRWPHAVLDDVPIRVTDGVGPMVVGVARAEIALPPWIVALPVAARRLVLAHEVEHQRAHDPLLLAIGGLAVLITPWHPLSWWMLRRLGVAIEVDCDARVLRRGVAARDYGLLLLDIASRSRPRSLLTPWPTLGVSSHLERRLLAMTHGVERASVSRMMMVGAVASALVLVACESKLPTSAEVEAMDGKTVVEESRKTLLTEVPATFTIDGRAATQAEVEALPSARIVEVKVQKAKTASGPGAVAVKTRAAGAVVEERVAPKGGVMFLRDSAQPSGMRVVTGQVTELHEVKVAPDGNPSVVVRGLDSASAARIAEERRATGGGVMMAGAKTFTGILMVDGVERPEADMRSLMPDQIDRVEVVKGSAAAQRFPNDPRAANGVIYIFTKAAKKN
jgi:beta-lactamase regulating signal transducer with metallopeptidase domain